MKIITAFERPACVILRRMQYSVPCSGLTTFSTLSAGQIFIISVLISVLRIVSLMFSCGWAETRCVLKCDESTYLVVTASSSVGNHACRIQGHQIVQ